MSNMQFDLRGLFFGTNCDVNRGNNVLFFQFSIVPNATTVFVQLEVYAFDCNLLMGSQYDPVLV